MFLALITLLTAITISVVAAYYSIIGLMAIFSGAALQIAIMGGALEVGKLVTASWLYQNWKNKLLGYTLKIYLFIAVIVLIFITSIGIFGFLSKAHLDQIKPNASNALAITQIDKLINQEETIIARAENTLDQLDRVMDVYIDRERVSKGLKERRKQKEERDELNLIITTANNNIIELNNRKFNLEKEVAVLEADVGPLKYIAELIYGEENARDMLDEAVRFLIIIFIFVFDPLAVLLLVSANISFKTRSDEKKMKKIDQLVQMRRRYKSLQTRHRNYRNKSIKGQPIRTTVTNEAGARKVVRQVGDVSTTTYE